MTHYRAKYARHEWCGLPVVQALADMSAPEVYQAIRERGFPPPSRNIVHGVEKWSRAEVEEWLATRGLRKTMRALG